MADALQGTWVFNDTLSLLQSGAFDTYFNLSFYDDVGNSYTSLSLVNISNHFRVHYFGTSGNTTVYDKSWSSPQYRTITITTPISELTGSTMDFNEDIYAPLASAGTLFLSWLQSNATKQEETPTYPKINSFTYHGKQINSINGKHIRYVHDKRAGMDNTYEMVYVVQLTTPQNVTAVGTTVSWDAVENATSYEILVSGSSFGTVSTTSVDLSTLSGWASLTDGEYSITIVAKADGYRDSEPSAGVSVTKAFEPPTDCITFTGESSDFTLKANRKVWNGTVEYSTDITQWTTWDGTAISSHNKRLYLRGRGNTTFYRNGGANFVLSAKAGCSGNLNTLLEYSNPPTTLSADNIYFGMFSGCTNLTTAPDLPATTLSPYCYADMFRGCTNLTTAPDLPATTLSSNCYNGMFRGCTNLTTAPKLPATTLASSCYTYMFSGCTKLTTAPKLPATTLARSCYNGMFSGCTNLTTAPDLPAKTLATSAKSCYAYMFSGCKSLTKAPNLPATTLSQNCYSYMFAGCTSLKISATQSSEYSTAWRIPSTGTISSTAKDWNYEMLVNTGGTFTSDPSINTTYYGAW